MDKSDDYTPMSIHTQKGTKVIFMGEGGFPTELKKANKLLEVGKIYTVKNIDIKSWRTEVYLEEVPGSFNSTMFKEKSED